MISIFIKNRFIKNIEVYSVFFMIIAKFVTPVFAGEEKKVPEVRATSNVKSEGDAGLVSATEKDDLKMKKEARRYESSDCLVDESIIGDLKRIREENAKKEKEFTLRETEIKSREQALAEEIKDIHETRDAINKFRDAKKKENEEKVNKIIETYLVMSPKAVSKILATLDDDLALAALMKMDTDRLAKVMNLMEPARSSRLSELMAGIDKDKNLGKKGGRKDDGNNAKNSNNEPREVSGRDASTASGRSEK